MALFFEGPGGFSEVRGPSSKDDACSSKLRAPITIPWR